MTERTCTTCGVSLWKRNQTGYCRKHISPETRAKMADGIRRKIKHDPTYLETLRSLARANSSKPGHMEKMRAASPPETLWLKALPSVTPEVRARAARTFSERCMAWCPRELRDEYRRLVTSKKLTAAQARQIILAQHEKNMAAFRRKLEAA